MLDQLKKSIVKHLKKHAAKGEWISQREMRNSIHAKSTLLFNKAVCVLAMDGIVGVSFDGPQRRKVIQLRAGANLQTLTTTTGQQ